MPASQQSSGSTSGPPIRRDPGIRLPDVVIIGAAKSGTTTLAVHLGRHPSICLSSDKEPEFFSHEANWQRGFAWYGELFAAAKPGQLCLEASTAYTRMPQCPDAAPRLRQHCPDARLIYLMRHPVDRAYSHYVHRFMKELHPNRPFDRTFEQHVVDDPMCLDSSDYKLQIERYFEYFPRSAFLFLFTHDLEADEPRELRRVCEFLDIEWNPDLEADGAGKENVARLYRESRVRIQLTNRIKETPVVGRVSYLLPRPVREVGYHAMRRLGVGRRVEKAFTAPPMRPETRRALIERFRPSNDWIAALTGADLSAWNR